MILWYVKSLHITSVSNLPCVAVGHYFSLTLTFLQRISTAFAACRMLRHVACSHRACQMRMLQLLPCCSAQFPCNTTTTCHGGGRTLRLPLSNLQDLRPSLLVKAMVTPQILMMTMTMLGSFAAVTTTKCGRPQHTGGSSHCPRQASPKEPAHPRR